MICRNYIFLSNSCIDIIFIWKSTSYKKHLCIFYTKITMVLLFLFLFLLRRLKLWNKYEIICLNRYVCFDSTFFPSLGTWKTLDCSVKLHLLKKTILFSMEPRWTYRKAAKIVQCARVPHTQFCLVLPSHTTTKTKRPTSVHEH